MTRLNIRMKILLYNTVYMKGRKLFMKGKINKYDIIEAAGAIIACVGTILGIVGTIGNRPKK